MSQAEEAGWVPASAYTAGLWRNKAARQAALRHIEQNLSTELLALRDAGRVALGRQDLPVNERNEFHEAVLRLALDWISFPLSARSILYPFFEAMAQDEDLAAHSRSTSLAILETDAEASIRQLLHTLEVTLPPGATEMERFGEHLLGRLTWMGSLFQAVDLRELPSLQDRWQAALTRAIQVGVDDLLAALDEEPGFVDQP
jgi:hypothetical protein